MVLAVIFIAHEPWLSAQLFLSEKERKKPDVFSRCSNVGPGKKGNEHRYFVIKNDLVKTICILYFLFPSIYSRSGLIVVALSCLLLKTATLGSCRSRSILIILLHFSLVCVECGTSS